MSGADVEQRFLELAAAWEAYLDEERASGNPLRKVQHPAFDDIVALGDAAVPLVMARYESGSLFWGAALARITGITAHGDGVTGNVRETRQRWLAWWQDNAARFS